MKNKRCIGPKWQWTWSCDLLRVGLNKVVWAYPQVTWSMLIWRTHITQFLPLASSLLLLPPSSPHPTTNDWGHPSKVPMAISNSSSRGSRCRHVSSLGEIFFFIFFFFLALLTIFYNKTMCTWTMTATMNIHHLQTLKTAGAQDVTHLEPPGMFFFNCFFFIHLTMTYR